MSVARGRRLRGRIAVHLRGFGFVDLDAEDAPASSAFVAPPVLNTLLDADLVEVTLEASGAGRYQAVDVELVERPRQEVVGTLQRSASGSAELLLDPRIGNTAWPIEGVPKGERAGAALVARPHRDRARLRYLRTVGDDDNGRTAVLVAHRIRATVAPAARAELRRLRVDTSGRRDLRGVATVTIDAASSKDLDDALAVLPPQSDGALRVLVSIADVDAAVPAGSALDAEARRRGTSVYLPDLVVPMLPPELSEDALSLLPGAERPALTAELRIDRDGEVTATDLATSLVRSTARVSYHDVAAWLDHGRSDAVPEEVRSTLRWLRAAAARLSAMRSARGGVTIEREEVALDLDLETGEPISLATREPTSAHLIVERLMVATNEAVAKWLLDRGLPALFRVQDELGAEPLEHLAEFAANFGFETAFGGRLSPRGLAAFEEQFRTSITAPSMRTVLGWLLGRARYQAAPAPHYALAAPAYVHFTSPIRRYPDLVVHRVVKAHLRGERRAVVSREELDAIAAGVNDAAQRARKAERERLRMLVARYFADRIGEEHRGRIVAVKPFGLVVQLDALGVTGTVSTEALGRGPWELDEATYALVCEGRRHMVGEALRLRLAATDEALGRLEFEPVPQR